MAESFGARLQERILDVGPLCLGIDPSQSVLTHWERSTSVEGVEFVALSLLDAAIEAAAAIKAQVAFFERFGSEGFRVLERVMAEARAAGVLVIADAKRGDIGSTNDGYAEAWLGENSPLRADAMTVSPYLGVGALTPFFDRVPTGSGVFVLAATSNPEGRLIQRARTEEGERIEDSVLAEVAALNARSEGLGGVGVVLGATRDRPTFDLAQLRGPYLVPGVGVQGATVSDVGHLFERCPRGSVLVNVARAIATAGPERSSVRDAARRWRDSLAENL